MCLEGWVYLLALMLLTRNPVSSSGASAREVLKPVSTGTRHARPYDNLPQSHVSTSSTTGARARDRAHTHDSKQRFVTWSKIDAQVSLSCG